MMACCELFMREQPGFRFSVLLVVGAASLFAQPDLSFNSDRSRRLASVGAMEFADARRSAKHVRKRRSRQSVTSPAIFTTRQQSTQEYEWVAIRESAAFAQLSTVIVGVA